MSDKREGGAPNPLIDSFAAGRSFIERPGQGSTPLGVERELLASLGITLADYSLTQIDGDPLYFGIRSAVGGVVAQRSGVQFVGLQRGFRLHQIDAANGTLVLQTGTLYALAGGAPSTEPGFTPKGPLSIALTSGAAALVGAPGYRIAAGRVFQPAHPIWIPAGVPLFIASASDNQVVDMSVLVSQPPVA